MRIIWVSVRIGVRGEPKNGTNKIFIFQNGNICNQDTKHFKNIGTRHEMVENPSHKIYRRTSRDRPKSAPYLRLKNGKRTSKCQVFSSTAPEKIFEKSLTMAKKLKWGTLGFSTSILSQKLKGDPLGIFFRKKKLKKGPFSLVWHCMLRGKPFWFRSLGQQVQFGIFLKFCRTFGRTILVTSGVSKKNTDEKPWL